MALGGGGKKVIFMEEAEYLVQGSSKWSGSLFPKQPGRDMYSYLLDLFPRAEACFVSGTEDVMFGLYNGPGCDSNKGHLVMLSFWDARAYLSHLSMMTYFFCIPGQHLSFKLSGTSPRGKAPALLFLLSISLDRPLLLLLLNRRRLIKLAFKLMKIISVRQVKYWWCVGRSMSRRISRNSSQPPAHIWVLLIKNKNKKQTKKTTQKLNCFFGAFPRPGLNRWSLFKKKKKDYTEFSKR